MHKTDISVPWAAGIRPRVSPKPQNCPTCELRDLPERNCSLLVSERPEFYGNSTISGRIRDLVKTLWNRGMPGRKSPQIVQQMWRNSWLTTKKE